MLLPTMALPEGFNPIHFSILILALTTARFLYIALTSPTRHLPGPWYTRLTHLRLKLAVVTGQRVFYIHSLHTRYGHIVRVSPHEVSVSDLDAFREIHRIGTPYLKSNWYQKLVNTPRVGVFSMQEPRQHSARRRLLARPFSRSFLLEHWEGTVRETVELCVRKIKQDAVAGSADVYSWWMLLASDISAHLAFGESFHMIETGHENQFLRVLKALIASAGVSVELPFLRILRFIPIPSIQEAFNGSAFVLSGASRAVETARAHTGTKTIFSNVLVQSEKAPEGLDDMDVRVEAMNIIVAGSDTTGVTLTYLTWAVLSQPTLQRALEAEVAALAPDFTENDLLALPLLNAVIEETLRLYGAAPSSLPRVVPSGGATLAGHWVPAGVTVATQAWTFHRDSDVWREPDRFDPTRWLATPANPTPEAQSAAARTAFHPFGAGARACLGMHLARMELRYGVAVLFRECAGLRLGPRTTPQSMEPLNFFLIKPKSARCEVVLDHE